MKSLLSRILTAVVIVSLSVSGFGLVFLDESPGGEPKEEPYLKLSPDNINLGGGGQYGLFTFHGFGETPEVFPTIGIDFGWDLLGPSAPMASFNDVGICPPGYSPESTPICMLEKDDPTDPTEPTHFKVSQDLVRDLAQQACDMGGCHAVPNNRKTQVSVTAWGRIDANTSFELNDLLNLIPECIPCRVIVTLKTVEYTGEDLGSDWSIDTTVQSIYPKKKQQKTQIPKNGNMKINHGDNKTIDKVIFDGIVGEKGDYVGLGYVIFAREDDPLGTLWDDWGSGGRGTYNKCPDEFEVVVVAEVWEDGTNKDSLATLTFVLKVVLDP